MKKIILGFFISMGLFGTTFGTATQVLDLINSPNKFYVPGDNRNGLANTNGYIFVPKVGYTSSSRLYDIYNNNGSFLQTIGVGTQFQLNLSTYPAGFNVNTINGLDYTILLITETNNTAAGGTYDSYGFYINKKSGVISVLFFGSTSGYTASTEFINYTFDNTNLYVQYKKYNGTSVVITENSFLLSNGNISTGTPLNGYDFSVTSNNTYYVNGSNVWYTKSKLTNELYGFYYDNSTNKVLNTVDSLINTNVNLFKIDFLDLNEYIISENNNSYQKFFGTGTITNYYTGIISYSIINGLNNYTFKLIPPASTLGLIDYDLYYNIETGNYGITPLAWWSGTGSNERLYYFSGSKLYFDGSTNLINNYANVTGITTVDTGINTNTGGFITFNNTGTGGSLSTLFANANAGSGSFLPDKLNFLFTSASTKVNSGGLSANCNPMFDVNGVFNYTKNAKSTFLINLSNGNILSLGARWNMEILGVNVIGWLYDILDWLLTMIQQIFGTILNGFFGLFSDVTGAVNIPVRNADYCFLGTNIYLQDNIKSYYSYSQKKNINVSGLNSIEMFYIFLLTIFLFVLVIKL